MARTTNLEVLIEGAASAETRIPVHISYEIIRLFSEGLYQSPQKAIEELVSNSYDAGARAVHVLLPREPDADQPLPPLWVIDNGGGMDASGFFQLWRVADSAKAKILTTADQRPPIGQFGIGKLAAYVLAWRLTHISCVDGVIRSTSMNFRELTELHQYERLAPFDLQLYEFSKDQAKTALADVEERDPAAWKMMFGPKAASSWTAAALSDFKELYNKLSAGRLNWVLSTGLPLHSTFRIFLDGDELKSSKLKLTTILTYNVAADDNVASSLGLAVDSHGLTIPGIDGHITGTARIFRKRLTEGKSDQYDRSHGFFVRVRGRVVNLEDELFGLDALNHAAWARFSMEITADGLRNHLLSSREGVRESVPVETLRKYLHGVFNACRRAYDDWSERELAGLDLEMLLRDAPSLFVTEPILAGVRDVVATQAESYYVTLPEIDADTSRDDWLREFAEAVADTPIARVLFEGTGRYDRVLRFIPDTRTLVMNTDHPFIDKLVAGSRSNGTATLFGSAEVLLDVLLQENGVSAARRIDLFDDRDRILRLLAGDQPSTAAEVLRLLSVANRNETALERAVGAAFRVLGFEYERRGGNVGGADGVLYARLGRGNDALADYRVVYDAKQTNEPSVPADKINLNSLEDFREKENAHFAFFLAGEYAAQNDPEGKLNRLVRAATSGTNPQPITLLRIADLRRIVELHYRYGLTLTRLRSLFQDAHTVPQVTKWVDELEHDLARLEPQVPLQRLLAGIEASKTDRKARPNVYTVRAVDTVLREFTPERLVAALGAVETIVGRRWLEVQSGGDVLLHHTAPQIVAEVERHLRDLFGVDAIPLQNGQSDSADRTDA
jgi:Histidine kinase-, DNA gyrase B-, and HSP90-like ATPase